MSSPVKNRTVRCKPIQNGGEHSETLFTISMKYCINYQDIVSGRSTRTLKIEKTCHIQKNRAKLIVPMVDDNVLLKLILLILTLSLRDPTPVQQVRVTTMQCLSQRAQLGHSCQTSAFTPFHRSKNVTRGAASQAAAACSVLCAPLPAGCGPRPFQAAAAGRCGSSSRSKAMRVMAAAGDKLTIAVTGACARKQRTAVRSGAT